MKLDIRAIKSALNGAVLSKVYEKWRKEATTDKSDMRAMLAVAMLHHLVVEITYADKEGTITHRCIDPVEFQDNGNVLAHCHLRGGGYRAFTFGWIFSARLTGDTFEPQEEKKHPAKVPNLKMA
jgi:predicted DNA-binding transcriptional regulator YafY